jgi:hypothetical protein
MRNARLAVNSQRHEQDRNLAARQDKVMTNDAADSKPGRDERKGQSGAVKPGQGTEASLKGGAVPASHKAEKDWEESPKESGE